LTDLSTIHERLTSPEVRVTQRVDEPYVAVELLPLPRDLAVDEYYDRFDSADLVLRTR